MTESKKLFHRSVNSGQPIVQCRPSLRVGQLNCHIKHVCVKVHISIRCILDSLHPNRLIDCVAQTCGLITGAAFDCSTLSSCHCHGPLSLLATLLWQSALFIFNYLASLSTFLTRSAAKVSTFYMKPAKHSAQCALHTMAAPISFLS